MTQTTWYSWRYLGRLYMDNPLKEYTRKEVRQHKADGWYESSGLVYERFEPKDPYSGVKLIGKIKRAVSHYHG